MELFVVVVVATVLRDVHHIVRCAAEICKYLLYLICVVCSKYIY